MKLLINDKEIANFLFSRLDHKEAAKDIEMSDNETVLQIVNEVLILISLEKK
jgi:hypothetical protein